MPYLFPNQPFLPVWSNLFPPPSLPPHPADLSPSFLMPVSLKAPFHINHKIWSRVYQNITDERHRSFCFTLFDGFQGSCEHDSMLCNNRLCVCACVWETAATLTEKNLNETSFLQRTIKHFCTVDCLTTLSRWCPRTKMACADNSATVPFHVGQSWFRAHLLT